VTVAQARAHTEAITWELVRGQLSLFRQRLVHRKPFMGRMRTLRVLARVSIELLDHRALPPQGRQHRGIRSRRQRRQEDWLLSTPGLTRV
jgi:hypothetical protein